MPTALHVISGAAALWAVVFGTIIHERQTRPRSSVEPAESTAPRRMASRKGIRPAAFMWYYHPRVRNWDTGRNLIQMAKRDHQLRNSVLATVISTILLAVLAALWPPFEVLLAWLWAKASSLVGLATGTYELPGWLIIILAWLSLVTVVRFFRGMQTPTKPAYTSYVQDSFYGATWRWVWTLGRVSSLSAYCPRCDAELVYDDSSCRQVLERFPRTDFICEHCNHSTIASIPGGDNAYSHSAVEREIRRKIRVGEVPSPPH